jgi:dsDNA-specific endonuclease/ATPase MutS2
LICSVLNGATAAAAAAAVSGTRINNGVMLGSSVGGGMTYIEPAQVVSLNNELMAARAEAMAAEEAVLWELSGRLMGCLDDVETVRIPDA